MSVTYYIRLAVTIIITVSINKINIITHYKKRIPQR